MDTPHRWMCPASLHHAEALFRKSGGKRGLHSVGYLWDICGIFVEQSQSFHRFSARWKICCKRGNASTKNHLYRRLNRYMAVEMDCPAVLLAQNPHAHRKRCRHKGVSPQGEKRKATTAQESTPDGTAIASTATG